ncbi:hypothetical protein [Parasphingorhabdus sp.]|uniref:hypothetical protein n=1 Tax=Parasphingorhabdus sp. TaxID=2709688 RepID=UPI003A8ED9CC
MKKGILLTRVSAKPGQEDEFLNWYRSYFTPYVASLPGFVSARVMRFKRPASNEEAGSPNAFDFLTIYELEADDLQTPLRHLREAEVGHGDCIKITEAVSFDPVPTEWLYEDLFVTSKPTSREGLEWRGKESESAAVETVVDKVLGWVPD